MTIKERRRSLDKLADIICACDVEKLKKALSDSEAEVARLKLMIQWQPIETAPKDGTRIILLMGGIGQVFGMYQEQPCHKKPKPYWTCDKESTLGTHWMRGNQPLYWMPEFPLPEPPNAK